jgi:hypothetical protein
MKHVLSTTAAAAVLALIAPLAHAAAENSEAQSLRAECAARHAVSFDAPAQSNEYRFVYSKGQYRGEAKDGQPVACAQAQYGEFLASADPVRVMNAYPTAAGRAKVTGKAASK